MADKYINSTGLQTIKTWIEGKFATIAALTTLSGRVDDIVAEGGEPNVIETVKVNNTALVPDQSKAVNVAVPTATSELTNDGDGTSNFATEDYVAQNGGKIDSISVNGVAQTIDANKNVDLTVQQFNVIEYGVTHHADIAAMFSKPVLFKRSNYFLPITGLSTDTNGSYIIYCNGMLRPDSTTTLIYQTATVDVNDTWTESHVLNVFPTAVSDLTNDSGYQTASEVQSAIASGLASVVKLKGSVANYASLPATGNTHGDLWNTLDTGKNYVWLVEDGTGAWDDYAGTMDLSAYWTSTTGQTNTLEAATITEIKEILNA